MDDISIPAVLIGVITALIVVYLREALRYAIRKRVVVSQLGAYLSQALIELAENDGWGIAATAEEWYKEEKRLFASRMNLFGKKANPNE